MRYPGILLLLALSPNAPALAADCANAMTQADMNICAGNAAKAADSELNRLYAQMQARLRNSPSGKAALVSAQRSWIAFRDSECRFAASGVEGGSMMPMMASNCVEDLTRRRSADFKRYLACAEGEVGCPVPGN